MKIEGETMGDHEDDDRENCDLWRLKNGRNFPIEGPVNNEVRAGWM